MAPAMAERMQPMPSPPICLGMLDTDPAMQQGPTLTAAISATIEWLAGDDCHALDEAALAAELGRRLRSAGLPLDHLGLYLRTLSASGRLSSRAAILTSSARG